MGFKGRVGVFALTLGAGALSSLFLATNVSDLPVRWATPAPGTVSPLITDTQEPPAPVYGQTTSGRPVVVLNAWQYPLIPQVRAQHLGAVVLVYKDLSSSRPSACQNGQDQAELPTGVGFCLANAVHPEWFLQASGGGRLVESGYSDQYEMDYGNPSYQQAWLANVRSDVQAHGWDGVIMDNALTTADAYGVAAQYPSHASVQAAMRSMLAIVGPGLTSSGLLAIANIGGATQFPGLWDSWVSLLSGAEDEFFLCWGGGAGDVCQSGKAWSAYESEITDATSLGKMVLAHSGDYSLENAGRAFEYSLASYLLANGGASAYSFASTLVWHPEYGYQLGLPWGSYYNVAYYNLARTELYKRDFHAGTVMVNTSPYTYVVNLGAPYMDSSGARVSSVSIPPASGVVLRSTTGSPTGTPPPVVVSGSSGLR